MIWPPFTDSLNPTDDIHFISVVMVVVVVVPVTGDASLGTFLLSSSLYFFLRIWLIKSLDCVCVA